MFFFKITEKSFCWWQKCSSHTNDNVNCEWNGTTSVYIAPEGKGIKRNLTDFIWMGSDACDGKEPLDNVPYPM